ncbi:MAG TPA: hypothetical protein VFO54_08975, partial [Chryseosolibacter sp.]|nr:hypothetical protein [Chryseosolibacter sp.]
DMKTATKFFPLMIALMIISMAGNVNAQGRGHHKAHDRKGAGNHGNHHSKHEWKGDSHHNRGYAHPHDRSYAYHHDHRPQVRTVVYHHHDSYCHHEPVVVTHYHERPRYVYYRDYDVYYDMRREVYISYSGRNWTVSASLPVALHHVDVHRAVRLEVDYQHDDFPVYLQRSRPSYRRIYTGY